MSKQVVRTGKSTMLMEKAQREIHANLWLAFELGYKAAEKGQNWQAAQMEFDKTLDDAMKAKE